MYLLGFFKFSKDSFLSLAFQGAGVGRLKVYTLIYVLSIWFLFPSTLVLLFISMISFYFVLKTLNKKFSFVNGDCLGFTLEHTELILLNIGLALVL
jgi:adenosylcobinamide-GDP ribazoletransferase